MKLQQLIIPSPQLCKEYPGMYVFKNKLNLIYSSKNNDFSYVIKNIVKKFKDYGVSFKIKKIDSNLKQNLLVITNNIEIELSKYLSFKVVNNNEGYVLNVYKDAIVISSISPAGVFYGCQSLVQIITKEKTVLSAKCCEIRDWPMISIRGVSDDISRWQISKLDNFKKIIRLISGYKLNIYIPYIEDVFKLKKHPLVGKNRGALTKEEIQEIVNYGKEHFVDVIPLFQTLGHCEHLIRIKKYQHLAEVQPKPQVGPLLTPIGEGTTISPAVPQTYSFINDFATEFIPNFKSKYLHIGGDEPYDLGRGKSKKLAEQLGGIENLYRKHMEKVAKMMSRFNKQLIMYADIVLNHWRQRNFDIKFAPRINRGIILMNWRYAPQDDYPEVRKISEAGYTQIVSPSLHNYFRFYPAYFKAKKNIRNITYAGWKTKNVIGSIVSSWCDNGADNFRENNWYGYAYTSECTWHPAKVDDRTFTKRFVHQFFGIDNKLSKIIDYLSSIDDKIFAARRQYFEDFVFKQQDKNMVNIFNDILAKCIKYESLINKIKVRSNEDNLEYIKFSLKISQNYAKKMSVLHKLAVGEKVNRKIVSKQIEEIKYIKSEFARLWIKTNKPAGLWVTLWRFDKQIKQWQGLANIK